VAEEFLEHRLLFNLMLGIGRCRYENDGVHLNFPSRVARFELGMIEPNKDYTKQIEEINSFISNAKAYLFD
jgi:hypothetical protein